MKKVIMYLNQFFAGIGGEDQADVSPQLIQDQIGPAKSLNAMLKGGGITHTLVCGDGYMASNTEEALTTIGTLLDGIEFDLLIAGPAFMSGRYGVSCSEVCNYVHTHYSVPAITCMYVENPGVEMYPKQMYIMEGTNKAAGMRKDLPKLASLANKFLNNEEILWAEKEGYFPRGFRIQINLDPKESVAKRAVQMLKQKMAGEPYESELPISSEDRVPIAAPHDASKSRVAFITTCGVVPADNPDHILGAASTRFGRYSIEGLNELKPGEWITVHGGLDPQYANADPMLMMPLDALRRLEREGKIGYLHPYFYSTTGNQTNRVNAVRMAKEIIEYLKEDRIDTVIFGSC